PAFALRGFRVPAMMIAPWARSHQPSSEIYDHTSILKMIEWRWNLPSLTPRDMSANNIAEALDFSKTKHNAPKYSVPPGPFGAACVAAALSLPGSTPGEWELLQTAARAAGWPVT